MLLLSKFEERGSLTNDKTINLSALLSQDATLDPPQSTVPPVIVPHEEFPWLIICIQAKDHFGKPSIAN